MRTLIIGLCAITITIAVGSGVNLKATDDVKKAIENNNNNDNPPVVNNITENTYNIYYEDNKEAVEERDFYKDRTEELESEMNKQYLEENVIGKNGTVIFKNDYVEYDYSENY